MSRRIWIAAVTGLPLAWRLAAAENSRPIAVVYVSGVDAYAEALVGLRAGLSRQNRSASFVDLKATGGGTELANFIRPSSSCLLITVGSEALRSVLSQKTDAAVIPTMVLSSDLPQTRVKGISRGVHLDPSVASLVSETINLFPGKRRFGIIWNPAHDKPDTELPQRLKQLGIQFLIAECPRVEDLVKAFGSLKEKVDFVLALPDTSLYNNSTVRPLILSSLENRLPVVGFSASFVRAGAVAGVYPNFYDIGEQTAELALRALVGQDVPYDGPRKLEVAVNQRVMRLLGLSYKETPGAGPAIFR